MPAESVKELDALRKENEELRASKNDLKQERDESRKESRLACIALADEFIPQDQRTGAHLWGLPAIVKHVVEHHQWHHDAANAEYVKGIEQQRDAAREEVQALLAEIRTLKNQLEIIKRALDIQP